MNIPTEKCDSVTIYDKSYAKETMHAAKKNKYIESCRTLLYIKYTIYSI